MATAGARFVNVSPVRDGLEAGGAVEWLPIRPNTDTALMLALCHVLLAERLCDQPFLDRYCVGADRFAGYLRGDADGVAKDPAWAERITGIPAARTVALARDMATHRTMLNVAWALQRAAHGEQPFWAVAALAAHVGQVGLPGGGFGVGYGAMNQMGSPHPRLRTLRLPQGSNPVKAFIPVARHADMLLNPRGSFTYNGGQYTYPDIRLVYWAGGNPFHHHQDLNRLRRAWRKPETIVVHEQYWTAAARHADVVLPATIALERDDIGFATLEGHVVAMRKASEPVGESRDDYAIFADLAGRLGAGDVFTEGLTARQWVVRLYEGFAVDARRKGIEVPSFEQFWEEGFIDLSSHDRPVIMLQAFRQDPDRHPLPTPSGKIEIFSQTIADFAVADCPGHPAWMAPPEWLGADEAQAFPFHLISDQPSRKLHSQLDHGRSSMGAKVDGREAVMINPADAARKGITDGAAVELFNQRGRTIAAARVSDGIMPGVVKLSTGAWYDPDGDGDRHGNPNALTLDRGASGLSQGCAAQTCLVDVRPCVEPPPVRAHSLPRFAKREDPSV